MKLTIQVWGSGDDVFLHRLTEDQLNELTESGIEDDLMSIEEIAKVLDLEDPLETDNRVTGVYHDKIIIKVMNEEGLVVWESESVDFDEYREEYLYNDGNWLMIADFVKGNFFNYQLEIDDEFDPSLLVAETAELLDGVLDLITDIKYGDIEMKRDFGDLDSKGFRYSLN